MINLILNIFYGLIYLLVACYFLIVLGIIYIFIMSKIK
jgi:hypothetical protein